jgi:3-hydroxyisobutyrate dehydrogenase-like beta-hydroxyacid dehydrogenase
MRIGFIGLGNVGLPLARSLVRAGHVVQGFDLDPGRVGRLVAAGGGGATSVANAVGAAEVAITSLPHPRAIEAVVPGPGGMLAAMPAGSLWIEMSTTDAGALKAHAEEAAGRAIGVLEAPVTGGVNRAWTGEISILVGGDEPVFARHRALLEAMGGAVAYMGPLGSASVVKVITNMLAFVHLAASGEAMLLAKRAGVDLARAFEGIRISSGNSFAHETEGQLVLSGTYDCGFTMDLALKDFGLAMDLAAASGTPVVIAEQVHALFDQARAQYGGDAWSTAAVRLLEERIGEELRAPGFPDVLPGVEREERG